MSSKVGRAHSREKIRSAAKLLPVILLLATCSGCMLVKGAMELSDKAVRTVIPLNLRSDAVDPVDLQSQLIRFSDHYLDMIHATSGKLLQENDQPADRRILLLRRISVTDDVLAVATGSNIFANLLDMVIFVTLNRMKVEDFWMPKRFGESARPLLRASLDAEREIWRIAGTVLNKEQIEELGRGIRAWHEQHPDGRSPRDIGAFGFASEVAKMNRSSKGNTASVFNLLMIDPLSRLDPATRELANTRLFAERGLFLARRLPTLIRWESELFVLQTLEIPQMEKLLASASQLSQSAERFSQVSERLPDAFSSEREQIVKALNSQRPGLISLAAQIEKALAAGRLMSDASNATFRAFQDVLSQLDARPSNPNAEPFRITDYTEAAAQINSSAQQLVKLLEAFGQSVSPERLDTFSARVDALNRQAQAGGRELVDYAFRKILVLGVTLIGLGCTMVLAAVLLYSMIRKKFAEKKV